MDDTGPPLPDAGLALPLNFRASATVDASLARNGGSQQYAQGVRTAVEVVQFGPDGVGVEGVQAGGEFLYAHTEIIVATTRDCNRG